MKQKVTFYMSDDLILKELKNLILQGDTLGGLLVFHDSSTSTSHNKQYNQMGIKWRGSAINILRIRFGEDSNYYNEFMSCISYNSYYNSEFCKDNVMKATGILEYVHHALENGLIDDLFYKKEILILSDLLNQAYEFLNTGQKLAAGIYGRIVLETTIKEFAKKNDIHDGKFDQIIIKLKTSNIIQQPFEHMLRANYGIGSWAAHGELKFENLPDPEIKEFLTFIRDRVLTLE